MSWDTAAASHVPVRAYLTPPAYDDSTLDSTDITLEQITINPCCSHRTDALCVVSLWNVNGDIVPVQHVLTGLDWCARAHRSAGSDNIPCFDPNIAAFGPAETHQYFSTADEYHINRAEKTAGWTPSGDMVTGTLDMRSKVMKV